MSCEYLIRFDDICPTMNWRVWDRVEPILAGAGVKPLLAVVPDNRDPELAVDAPASGFWDRVRGWQQRGWAIGLHGFQHRYVTGSAGLLGRNRYSEFAGLPEPEQDRKLTEAFEIFRRNQVSPDAWVAPAHSFDAATVRVLRRLGVRCVSDGYARYPYTCHEGLMWVPQQLGKFRRMPAGVWTVCLHVNNWSDEDVELFRGAVGEFREQLTSLADVQRNYTGRVRRWEDHVFFHAFRMMRTLRGLKGGQSCTLHS